MWVLHRVLRRLARISLWSFFADVQVVGAENVPQDGPVIIVSTHHNMMIDPAVLSCTVPYKRVLHYWAKSSLFSNPVARWVMLSTGNIPVDRNTHDNQVLFRGTFDALAANYAVALFPEGTSYTEPRIMQVKPGAAWSTLEYTKYLQDHPGKSITLVPAAIVYTNKAKYRSSIIVEYGTPIDLNELKKEFMSNDDGAPKHAVRKLTLEVERRLVEMSINAPDWETLFAARTARDILWTSERNIKLEHFVEVSQTMIDVFCTPDMKELDSVKKKLLKYYSLLQSTKLTHADLAELPLPRELDPARGDVPLPSRLTTLSLLVRDTISCAVRLPFFALPLAIHAPAYFLARFGARLVENEEETQAQNKVVFGLILLSIVYPTLFFMLWAAFWLSPAGAILAFGLVYGLAQYHTRLIDDQYAHAKRVVAAWRVLVGVWMPRSWEPAVKPYEEPVIPPFNPYLDANKTMPLPEPSPRAPRPPRKRLVRHVLRARVECAKALQQLFATLHRDPRPLTASPHLAKLYGNGNPTRDSREVLAFLRMRGAVFEAVVPGESEEWGVLSSDEHEPRSPVDN